MKSARFLAPVLAGLLAVATAVAPAMAQETQGTPPATATGTDLGVSPAGRPLTPMTIVTTSGEHQFRAEIVETPEDRTFGLMFRMSIPDDFGMLFIFNRPQPLAFWMQNTFVSLDIIFIGEDGRVINIAKGTTPLSTASIPSSAPALYVLEVVAGTADRIGLQPGDLIRHDRIGTRSQF